MEKVRPWSGQPSDRGWLKKREDHGCVQQTHGQTHTQTTLRRYSVTVGRILMFCVRCGLHTYIHTNIYSAKNRENESEA